VEEGESGRGGGYGRWVEMKGSVRRLQEVR